MSTVRSSTPQYWYNSIACRSPASSSPSSSRRTITANNLQDPYQHQRTIGDKLAEHFGGGGHSHSAGFKVQDGRPFNEVKSECIEFATQLLNNLEQEQPDDSPENPNFELATYEQGNSEAERLAIVLPGRLDTKDYAHIRSHVDFLASLGYHALSFDPPGTWESPGDISLYTTTNVQQAIQEIIELFGDKPTVIAGHSRGGSHALLSGVAFPAITHMVAIMSHPGPTTVGLPTEGGGSTFHTRPTARHDTNSGTERV
ncbi:MAG: alpha/beta hydrolase [Candidatus Saccharibacteria bacterium]